jgi:hypothetical protein
MSADPDVRARELLESYLTPAQRRTLEEGLQIRTLLKAHYFWMRGGDGKLYVIDNHQRVVRCTDDGEPCVSYHVWPEDEHMRVFRESIPRFDQMLGTMLAVRADPQLVVEAACWAAGSYYRLVPPPGLDAFLAEERERAGQGKLPV